MGKILKMTVGDITTDEQWDVQEVYMPPGSVVLFHLSEPTSSINRAYIKEELSKRMGDIPWLLVPSHLTVSVLVPGATG